MKSASALLIAVVLVAATVASAADIAREVRGKCRQQMREQEEKLQHCQRYMRSAMQGAACGGGGCESRSNEDCCARECCRALRRMDEECACQTVKALAQQMTSEMTGRQLASRCGVTQQCDTRAVFV